MIDDLQQKLNQLDDSKDKQPLQQKLNQAQQLMNAHPFTKEIMVTEKPTNTLNAGILMGNGHNQQDLGIQLEKNSIIKIKQVNPNFKESLSLRLLTNDSQTETYTTFSDKEVQGIAKDLSVPCIDTPYIQANGKKPKIEVIIESGRRELPIYKQKNSLTDFLNKWATNRGMLYFKDLNSKLCFQKKTRNRCY